jgi:hypothetical protein
MWDNKTEKGNIKCFSGNATQCLRMWYNVIF